MPGGNQDNNFDSPPEDLPGNENAALGPFVPAGAGRRNAVGKSQAEQVRRKHENELLAIDGVEGVSVESDGSELEYIMVFVRDTEVRRNVPTQIEGVPVRVEVVGEFTAFVSAIDDG